MDVHDKKTRSFNMSMIKGKNTKPEIIVRKYLYQNGYRYRLNYSKLKGKPDIVLSKFKTVIFVNGCFWHGHEGCKYFVIPKTRTKWWIEKINKTKRRDHTNYKKLSESNWKVIVIWECELKNNPENRLEKLIKEIEE
jgi:DNA mismatch endonuclease (patch repair protein)